MHYDEANQDGQTRPPEDLTRYTDEEIKQFRMRCRRGGLKYAALGEVLKIRAEFNSVLRRLIQYEKGEIYSPKDL